MRFLVNRVKDAVQSELVGQLCKSSLLGALTGMRTWQSVGRK